jgi:hypothetical protein
LRRRAATTARPARVRIRSRKPWVRARRRLFGWKVRLLTFTLRLPVGAPNATIDMPDNPSRGETPGWGDRSASGCRRRRRDHHRIFPTIARLVAIGAHAALAARTSSPRYETSEGRSNTGDRAAPAGGLASACQADTPRQRRSLPARGLKPGSAVR